MAVKGSKYARKQIENDGEISEKAKASRFSFLENGKFLEVIYQDSGFLNIFNDLPLQEQIKAYRILKRLALSRDEQGLSDTDRNLAENSWHKLEAINKSAGLKIEEKQHYPLSADELHVIRMDCYGAVDARPRHQLSRFYKDLISKPLSRTRPLKDYDFDQAPSWQIFRQFSSFRKLEPEIRSYLRKERINPDILPLMGVRDFSDLIFRAFKKDDKQTKVFFSENGTPRNNYVKALAHKFGDRIAGILRTESLDERYIRSLLNAMKMFGKTDAEKLIIMEINFTPRVLSDLKQAGYETDAYRVGDPIPQKLIETLIHADQGKLLSARDENGVELKGKDFPSFEVHHVNAIVESGRLANIAIVNYRNNYLLVPSEVHRHVFHGFDKLIVSGQKEAYSRRLELVTPKVTFMFGFAKNQQIEYDWSNLKSFKRQMEEDSRYIVSYEDMMNRLAENRQLFMDNNKSAEFDVDNVVQIIRYKKALEIVRHKKKKTQPSEVVLKMMKDRKKNSK